MKRNYIQQTGVGVFIAGMFIMSLLTQSLTAQIVKETRNLSGFTGVSLAFSGDIFITQGSPYKVEIEADKSVMDVIISELDGNVLVLKTKNGVWRNLGQVKAYITLPEVDMLSISGSGDMICESALKSDEIELRISGSGSMQIKNLAAREIDAEVTGSGDIFVSGQASENSELDAVITGSGDIKADGIAVGEAEVRITGSGSASVNVLNELETNITGSGSVNYKGKPLVNANATGSGRTRSIN